MHRDLIVHYITMHYLINSPFAPHMAEHVWKMLGNRESVLKARWPARQEPNTLHLQMSAYLDKTETKVRQALDKQKKAVTKATIYVAKVYPEWQAYILNYLTEKFDANDGKLPDNKTISADLKVSRCYPLPFCHQCAITHTRAHTDHVTLALADISSHDVSCGADVLCSGC